MKIKMLLFAIAVLMLPVAPVANAEEPVKVKYSRQELETIWRQRLQSFLDIGVIPIIDMESTISRRQAEEQLYDPDTLKAMDKLGLALVVFDSKQAPKDGVQEGHRWGYHVIEAANRHPDRYIAASNGGISKNWRNQNDSMISQTEEHVRSGEYPIMGEFEFRHYPSQGECKDGRMDREVNIAMDAPNGHRLFKLSAETGVPFIIHNDPEDAALDSLEKMLAAYPKAKVIQAHFSQIRIPEKQKRFTPKYVRYLLSTYPNLYYDLSIGHPGRKYKCKGKVVLDTYIWKNKKKKTLDPDYRAILTDFSDRFVAGMDYGGGRPPLDIFWGSKKNRVGNIRLIIRDLPNKAKHNIAYRNAWKLLTGKEWE